MENVHSRRMWLEEVKSLFSHVADPKSQRLNLASFVEHVSDVRVQVNFKKLGIDIEKESPAGLFELLDFQGDGFVDLDEFALGIQMFHGNARSIDMARLRYLLCSLSTQVLELTDSMRAQQDAVECLRGLPTGAVAG